MIYKKWGVIFDLDGVLIDSTNVMEIAFTYAFRHFFPTKMVPFEEYKTHMGKGFQKIMSEMNLPIEMHPLFKEKSTELASNIKVFEGAIETLNLLQEANCYIGLATGKDYARTVQILEEKGMDKFFDKIVTSDMVENSKPHPESIEVHMENSRLTANDFIFIGDSVSDIQCAKAASVRSIAVTWGMGQIDDLKNENPGHMVNDFLELKEVLELIIQINHSNVS
ncbi:HAD family hydrolase [Paenibacillus sp.]|jgi:3-amino-5-hydroxybenzoic acid synthesis related protein|uniref:HAD family hydrolase n=1 Tax=Paenibacillus sp. TaxID=58172 RepID=UPI0028372186|nr:HAD family hydrolase [Paenibacillus sp.]MDR0270825.1 HAD family hydrolase [Paenibacillus sp.]